MKRWIALMVFAVCVVSGGYVRAQEVPTYRAQVVQDEAGALTVSQVADLTARLSAYSPEIYRVLVVRNAGGADMTDYLDHVWEVWKLPSNSLLVVVFTEGGNIRIHMGHDLSRYGLNGQVLTQVAREVFGPLAREGKLVEATAALANDLHRRIIAGGGESVSQPAPASQEEAPVPPVPSQSEVPRGQAQNATDQQKAKDEGSAWMWRVGGALMLLGGALVGAVALFGRSRRPARRA